MFNNLLKCDFSLGELFSDSGHGLSHSMGGFRRHSLTHLRQAAGSSESLCQWTKNIQVFK